MEDRLISHLCSSGLSLSSFFVIQSWFSKLLRQMLFYRNKDNMFFGVFSLLYANVFKYKCTTELAMIYSYVTMSAGICIVLQDFDAKHYDNACTLQP